MKGPLVLAIALILCLTPERVTAQTLSTSGTVIDPSGAAVPKATVTLRDGSQMRTVQTQTNGSFLFDNLSAGTYEISVQSDGFKPLITRVTVSGRTSRPLELKLQIVNLEQQISVDAGGNQVSTETDENTDATKLDTKAMDSLPMLDGDYIGTISRFLDAGAIGTNGVSLVVDGMEVNSVGLSSAAIKEIKINQNPYSPEFMRPGRGRIEIITKPGASAYHGAINFMFRDNRLNAREPFAATRPPEQRRSLEATLLGPLGSGKTSSFLITGNYRSESAQAIVYATDLAGIVQQNVPNPQRSSDFSARITHQFGQRLTSGLRYEGQDQYNKGQGVGGTTLAEAGYSYRHREDAFTYTQSTTFTPKLINDFQILFGKEYEPTRSDLAAPKIVVLDAFTAGGAQADRLQTEYHTQFHDVTSWIHGRHNVKFGVDVPDISRRGLEDHTNFLGTFTFSSLADYQQGVPFSFVQQSGDGKVIFWEKVFSEFVLDDIHLKPNFTLSLAARYDWENLFHDDNNISPRLAFAYSPAHHSNTVFRGGAGFFYDRTGAGPAFDLLRYDGHHLFQDLITNPSYPNAFSAGADAQTVAPNIVKLAPDVRIPYTLQFGIGVERQLNKSTTVSLNYSGTIGEGMFRSRDINAPLPPFYDARPDPNIGVVRQIESSGRYESNALDIGLRGNVTHIFSGMIQYTFSHSYNDTSGIASFPSNNYDLRGEWGRADFDQRHKLNLLGTFRSGKLLNLGLAMSLTSGRPYTETTGIDQFNDGLANDRPAGVARNTLEGPAYADYDLRWSHDFKVQNPHDEVTPTFNLALDAFNVFNQVNYTSYIGTLTSPFFGRAVSAQPPRRLQLSARYTF